MSQRRIIKQQNILLKVSFSHLEVVYLLYKNNNKKIMKSLTQHITENQHINQYKLATEVGGEALKQGKEFSKMYTDRRSGGIPVLPCGPLNFKSGNNKYFNIYENGESVLEIYQCQPFLCIVSTSGDSPLVKIGENCRFSHDQSGKFLFSGEMVDWIKVDGSEDRSLDEIAKKYGVKSMKMYVYK